ncbi:hypothetical protein A9J31_05765 [Acinetobacter gandensis]|uniref:Uncharacterized protein n=1 Tax=Acinetobacter gandensis TaxID=1443941 RepID=A0A1A7R9I6_9GAMM|nr:hypothetical protein A9J31_05765 [Acinetobacter gandensis]
MLLSASQLEISDGVSEELFMKFLIHKSDGFIVSNFLKRLKWGNIIFSFGFYDQCKLNHFSIL